MRAKRFWNGFPLLRVLLVALVCVALLATAAPAAEEAGSSCLEPAQGPVGGQQAQQQQSPASIPQTIQTARVGKEAPDFEALAYHEGGFKKVKLSEYRGQWVVLCFYPGDFTFV